MSFTTLFLHDNTIRSGWRLILFLGASYVLLVMIAGLNVVVFPDAPRPANGFYSTPFMFLTVVVISSCLFTRYIDRRPLSTLGFNFRVGWTIELAGGFLVGTFLNYLVPVALAAIEAAQAPWHLPSWLIEVPSLYTIREFLIVALWEELFFRGYLLQTAVEAIGRGPAITTTSILFGLGHGAQGAFLPATLIGILLGLTVLRTGRLWVATGFHMSWNLVDTMPQNLHVELTSSPIYLLMLILAILSIWQMKSTKNALDLWSNYIKPARWPLWKGWKTSR